MVEPTPYRGRVAHGKKTGSKLGFPTANLYFDENRQLPKFGIYASKVEVNGKVYQGVTNVGIRPSFDDGNSPSVETLLLDFDDNIYNKLIHVNFIHFLREEKKFDRISDLIEQIKKDKRKPGGSSPMEFNRRIYRLSPPVIIVPRRLPSPCQIFPVHRSHLTKLLLN